VITIKELEKAFAILIVEANTEVVDGLLELLKREGLTAIVIGNSELTAKTLNATCTSGSQLLAHNFA